MEYAVVAIILSPYIFFAIGAIRDAWRSRHDPPIPSTGRDPQPWPGPIR